MKKLLIKKAIKDLLNPYASPHWTHKMVQTLFNINQDKILEIIKGVCVRCKREYVKKHPMQRMCGMCNKKASPS